MQIKQVSQDRPVSAPSLRYARYVVTVLMICYTLSFIDRQILSLLVGPLKRDLGLSDTRIGLLQGFAFALFYTILGLPLGRIVDIWNRRNLVAFGVFFWSLMTAASSVALSFATLFVARMGVGVGEATLTPGAMSLIADYFPKERMGRAMSLYSMGIFIGSGLALIVGGAVVHYTAANPSLVVPFLGAIASWRLTFLIVGVPGIFVAMWVLTVREPVRKNLLLAADGRPTRLSIAGVVEEIRIRWQSILGISSAMIFQSASTFAFMAWAPAFFLRTHQWNPAQTGRALGLITLVFGSAGMYVGGMLADYWMKQGIREAHLRAGVLGGICTLAFVPAFLTNSPVPTLCWSSVGVLGLGIPVGSAFAGLQLILPNQVRGQVSGLFILIFNLGGQTLGPLAPALLNDYVFHSGAMIGTSLAVVFAISGPLAAILFRVVFASYRRHDAAMEASATKA
jgi:MFS family permease